MFSRNHLFTTKTSLIKFSEKKVKNTSKLSILVHKSDFLQEKLEFLFKSLVCL